MPSPELAQRVERLLSQSQLPSTRQRKGRQVEYDLRPLVLDLTYGGLTNSGWQRLHMTLRSEPGATGRPDAVVSALGLDGLPARIERLHCFFSDP